MQDNITKIFLKALAVLSLSLAIISAFLGILFKIESWQEATKLLVSSVLLLIPTIVLFWKSFTPSIIEAVRKVVVFYVISIGLIFFTMEFLIINNFNFIFPYEFAVLGSILFTIGILLLQKKNN